MVSGGGVGCAIRSWEGKFVGSVAKKISHLHYPLILEAMTILESAIFANLQNVILESDSLVVIEALKNLEEGPSYLSVLIANILDACSAFRNVVFSWTPRSCNQVARIVATSGKELNSNCMYWMNDSALSLIDVLRSDVE